MDGFVGIGSLRAVAWVQEACVLERKQSGNDGSGDGEVPYLKVRPFTRQDELPQKHQQQVFAQVPLVHLIYQHVAHITQRAVY